MALEDIANVAEIVGMALVIISLLFVAAQLRQSNRTSESAARAGWSSNQGEWHRHGALDPDMARILIAAHSDDVETLTPEERQRFVWWYVGYFHSWEAHFHATLDKQIPREFRESMRSMLAGFFEIETHRKWWESERGRYTQSFTRFVDEIIADAPADHWVFQKASAIFSAD